MLKSDRVKATQGAAVNSKTVAPARPPAIPPDTVYSARLTLKEWLTHLENAGLLKPGATLRILTNRKLKRITVPAASAG
jgi:hypothetical protein